MRRILPLFILVLLACRVFAPLPTPTIPAGTASLTPTLTAAPPPTARPEPPARQVPHRYEIRLHPDGLLYVGDQVSVEVIAAENVRAQEDSAIVQITSPISTTLGQADFNRYGIGGRTQATLMWAWDTRGLASGNYTLTYRIHPDGLQGSLTIRLHPASDRPQAGSHWAVAQNDCCLVHYITGTAVERDLDDLLRMLDEQAAMASRSLNVEFGDPILINLLPRVLGHGGFASDEISVSYLDRNYASNNTAMVIHHELIHILDARLGGELRPTLLVEGLAVYLTGGHFKKEPLMERAAALLAPPSDCISAEMARLSIQASQMVCSLGWYLPLKELVDDFYFSQHEIGYLEAGSLVQFMVETWGWEKYSAFYRDIHPVENRNQVTAIETALQAHFGLDLADLEANYLAALRQIRITPENVEDVQLTVAYYNAVRRYQQILDPSAYFLNAWLPDEDQMREKGIVADLLRRPSMPPNLALENLLVATDQELQAGNYDRVEVLLAAANASLDILVNYPNHPHSAQ
jgi:hypothetical protein